MYITCSVKLCEAIALWKWKRLSIEDSPAVCPPCPNFCPKDLLTLRQTGPISLPRLLTREVMTQHWCTFRATISVSVTVLVGILTCKLIKWGINILSLKSKAQETGDYILLALAPPEPLIQPSLFNTRLRLQFKATFFFISECWFTQLEVNKTCLLLYITHELCNLLFTSNNKHNNKYIPLWKPTPFRQTSDVQMRTSRIQIQTPWIRIQANSNPSLFSWIRIRIRHFEVWIRIQLKKPWIRMRIRIRIQIRTSMIQIKYGKYRKQGTFAVYQHGSVLAVTENDDIFC